MQKRNIAFLNENKRKFQGIKYLLLREKNNELFTTLKKEKRERKKKRIHSKGDIIQRFEKRVNEKCDSKLFPSPPNSIKFIELQIIGATITTQKQSMKTNNFSPSKFPNYYFQHLQITSATISQITKGDPDFTDILTVDNRYATMRQRD